MSKIMIHSHSQATIGRAHNSMYNGKFRHKRYNITKWLISSKIISINYVKSKENLKDSLNLYLEIKYIKCNHILLCMVQNHKLTLALQ